ncbi:MAG: mucD [Candidatus Saccharibacteria bacterium]|nr:mucD [Candidatus Saccharibacteria bacterium]
MDEAPNTENPISRQTPHSPTRRKVPAFLLVLAAVVIGLTIAAVVSWLVYVGSGLYEYDSLDSAPTHLLIQALAWIVGGTFGVLYLLSRFLKKSSRRSARIGRWTIHILNATVLVLGGVAIILLAIATQFSQAVNRSTPLPATSTAPSVSVSDKSKSSSDTTCDMETTLEKAIGATYPVATENGTGTAFAIDANGTLLTAYHVIEGAQSIVLNLEDGQVKVDVVNTAPDYDLALLKVDRATPEYLDIVTNYDLAEDVYVLGWPGNTFFTGQVTLSQGIVSRTVSTVDVQYVVKSAPDDISFVQTDAAVNPGNSGGALVNACGAIGVISAISTSSYYSGLPREEGITYAISGQSVKNAFNSQ